MPDNVETGFKSAATMVRKVGDNKSLAERNKEKRFLINLWIRTVSEVDKENENVIQEVDKSKIKNRTITLSLSWIILSSQWQVIPKVPLMALAIRNLKITIR